MSNNVSEVFTVEIQRTITTTVKVVSNNPLSAAKIVDRVAFPLPAAEEWDTLDGWTYIVRNSAGEELYEGDASEPQS